MRLITFMYQKAEMLAKDFFWGHEHSFNMWLVNWKCFNDCNL